MLFNKPATTVEAQLALLQERGLAISDPAEAVRQLRAIGYYRLSAYWLPFELPPAAGQTRSKQFRPGVSWDEIFRIYVFDRKLRLLVLEGIERIEVAVRSSWTNHLTLESGFHPQLDSRLFTDGWSHAAMLSKLATAIAQSQEVFIKHYREKYVTPYMPPLWAVSEALTLGELSKWVASTKSLGVRKTVAREVGLPSHEVLEGVLQVLSLTRNICAHHGRLWNRRFVKRLPRVKRLASEMVVDQTEDGTQRQPRNLIYNTLVVILYLLRHQSDDTSYPMRLADLMCTVTNEQRAAMDFPDNWRDHPIWGLS